MLSTNLVHILLVINLLTVSYINAHVTVQKNSNMHPINSKIGEDKKNLDTEITTGVKGPVHFLGKKSSTLNKKIILNEEKVVHAQADADPVKNTLKNEIEEKIQNSNNNKFKKSDNSKNVHTTTKKFNINKLKPKPVIDRIVPHE